MTYEWTYPDGSVHYADPHFSSITYDDAGYYSLLATDNMGCYDQKTINVIVSPNPVAAFHGTDTLAVAPGYILEAGYGLLEYLWNTGSTEESITIDTTGWYWVDMTSRVGCKGLDSIFMYIDEDLIRECLYIPNAFTPNADNLNDVFKVYSKCPLTYFRMEIFNRWGEFLWSTEDINEGWDGKKHGNTLPGDAYVYKIAYRTSEAMADEVPMTVAGVVLKLR
jgi:gliding motility-associated-like protein